MDLVSVIIPYYKKRDFISDTINSVLKQTYNNLEIIIIYDDVQIDELNFLKKIARKDKRIIVIKNKNNLGAGLSRNEGIKKSKGEYIAFLDADDLWHEEKISEQISFMKKNSSNISHTSYAIINDKTKKIVSLRKAKNFNKVNDLLKSCDIGLSTVILKKKILLENDLKFPNLKTKEDFVLWLKILIFKNKIFALNEILTTWRKSKNSLSDNILQKILDGFKVYNKYMGFNFVKSIYYLLCLSFNYLKK